jgi:hypothetical protein
MLTWKFPLRKHQTSITFEPLFKFRTICYSLSTLTNVVPTNQLFTKIGKTGYYFCSLRSPQP